MWAEAKHLCIDGFWNSFLPPCQSRAIGLVLVSLHYIHAETERIHISYNLTMRLHLSPSERQPASNHLQVHGASSPSIHCPRSPFIAALQHFTQ
ncbi:hypothetical protein PoB_006724300 [Plakobranchus ocellatus]|uniref:Uncharacterized protein n=1 Tax=Plakobranchus ocellatus TaxID=259542 RepID=A0AAV4D918_9GAST|nr:hypothetical protein PoB_006724300 [Plakobranchus ocellatus]